MEETYYKVKDITKNLSLKTNYLVWLDSSGSSNMTRVESITYNDNKKYKSLESISIRIID